MMNQGKRFVMVQWLYPKCWKNRQRYFALPKLYKVKYNTLGVLSKPILLLGQAYLCDWGFMLQTDLHSSMGGAFGVQPSIFAYHGEEGWREEAKGWSGCSTSLCVPPSLHRPGECCQLWINKAVHPAQWRYMTVRWMTRKSTPLRTGIFKVYFQKKQQINCPTH